MQNTISVLFNVEFQRELASDFHFLHFSHLVDVEPGLEETSLLVDADRRLDGVLHEADLVPPHVVLDVDPHELALDLRQGHVQPHRDSANHMTTLNRFRSSLTDTCTIQIVSL